jgi:pyruvate/2-oxoglutarate dehydrogenase complex dihydrolipoamide dehydrogenase (E3) component
MSTTYDLIVLGGGRAASLAIAAAKAGWKTALIEGDRLGGTCPNRGCVPSSSSSALVTRRVRPRGRTPLHSRRSFAAWTWAPRSRV